LSEARSEEEFHNLIRRLRDDPLVFCEVLLNVKLFPHQISFIEDKSTRIVVCGGRQAGKSLMASALALWFALSHKKANVLIASANLRQSMETFQKIRELTQESLLILGDITTLTRTKIRFMNGSEILALPCGASGNSVRCYTAHMVIYG
jgi:Terminase large subunit, T4likevirus-type, N-terminal